MISSVSPFAGGMLGAARAASGIARSQGGGDFSAVMRAQADAAKSNTMSSDEVEAHNAEGFKNLEAKGIKILRVSMAGNYQETVLAKVNSDRDAWVSSEELSAQVLGGGGSAAQAEALYKLMDVDRDGKVSGQEFMDSIPDSPSSKDFLRQRDIYLAEGKTNPAAYMNLVQLHSTINTASLLAEMGRNVSVRA